MDVPLYLVIFFGRIWAIQSCVFLIGCSLGFCILLAHGISFISHKLAASSDSNHEDERLANGLNHQKEESQKKRSTLSRYEGLLMVVIVIIVAILMCRTIDRNKVWRNRETLFR